MIKKGFFLLAILLLISCKDKESHYDEIRKIKTNFIGTLMSKYKTKSIWSEVELNDKKYSIEFESIVNSSVQLIQNFKVIDVFRKNKKVYLLIEADFKYVFELEIEEEMYSKVISLKDVYYFEEPCVLIVNIEFIRKPSLLLNADYDSYEEEEPFVYMDYVSSSTFYGKGILLNIECIN